MLVLLLHLLEPEFNPVRRLVSEYVLGDFGYLMKIAFLALGSGIGLLGIGLGINTNPGKGMASRLLIVSSIFIMLGGIFDADPTTADAPTTINGTIHYLVIGGAMLAGLIAAFILANKFNQFLQWRQSSKLAFRWTILLLILTIIQIATVETDIAGLLQRIFILVVLGWLLFVTNLLRLSHIRTPVH